MLLQIEGCEGAHISQAIYCLREVAHELCNCNSALWQGEVQDEGGQKYARHFFHEQYGLQCKMKFRGAGLLRNDMLGGAQCLLLGF